MNSLHPLHDGSMQGTGMIQIESILNQQQGTLNNPSQQNTTSHCYTATKPPGKKEKNEREKSEDNLVQRNQKP